MEEIIEYIRSNYNGEFTDDEIKKLVEWFREKGVTVMALEELIKFYSEPSTISNEDLSDNAFISPSEVFKTSNDVLKQENENLMSRNNELERKVNKLDDKLKSKKSICNVQLIVIILLVIALLLIVFLK